MGIITLIILLALELSFLIWSIITKNNRREEKGIISIALLVLFCLLVGTSIYEWGFRYLVFGLVLMIQTITGIIILIKRKEKEYKLSNNIIRFVRNSFLYTFALFLAILCPQYKQFTTTGTYDIETAKYTWVDNSRVEQFSKSGENRALTVEFWYPDQADASCPLVVFSHGAFGFSGSNYSTFAELASNGYVVASIGHTYQAFYTLDTAGKLTIVNSDFINKAIEISANTDPEREEEIFHITSEWMKLRTEDENFVLNTILSECANNNGDPLFSIIDTENIGLMGHSLGGATSAQMGRLRNDIDAVIVLDGTMLGEEIAYDNNKIVLNNTPYPVPLLNIYAEDHYTNAMKSDRTAYANFNASRNAVCSYETVFKDAGHLNFTDLPLFSPTLAKMLGVGAVDERYCIKTMNEVVLTFFNCYLKGAKAPTIEKEY